MIRNMIRKLGNGRANGASRMGHTTAPIVFDREEVGEEPRHHVPRIVITRGRGTGRDEAVGTQCVIGRVPGSDICVQDPGLSRRHAYIALQGGVYVIHDLGSRNGTIVNGRRVRSATLGDGDVILLGRVEFLFRWREVAAEENAPARPTAARLPEDGVAGSETRPAGAPADARSRRTSSWSVVRERRHRWGS